MRSCFPYTKYRAIRSFVFILGGAKFNIKKNEVLYILIDNTSTGYTIDHIKGHYFRMPRELFKKLYQDIEIQYTSVNTVKEEPDKDHTGQTYNEYTGKWAWL